MPKSKAKTNTHKNNKGQKKNKQREVMGVILIALGVFLFACMLFGSTGILGRVVKPVMYGLFGLSSYIMALLIGCIGFGLIIMDKKRMNKVKISVILLSFFVVFNLLHIVAIRLFDTGSYKAFIVSGYNVGMTVKGQGALNAVLTYPVWKLIGTTGSIIFYCCVLLVLLVVFTNVSLKKVSNSVGANVKDKFDDTKEFLDKRREQKEQKRIERMNEQESASEKKRERPSLFNHLFGDDDGNGNSKSAEERYFNRDYSYADGNGDGKEIQSSKVHFVNITGDVDGGEREFSEDENGSSIEERKSFFLDTSTAKDDTSIFSAPLRDGRGKTTPENAPGAKISINDKTRYTSGKYGKVSDNNFLHLLKEPEQNTAGKNRRELEEKSAILENTLESFNVSAKVVNITCGPTITRYELQPAHGVKITRILSLQDDIKMALAAKDIRIEAPIPGKNAVGIEIPNDRIRTVYLREVLESSAFKEHKSKLAFALGIDIDGNSVVADLKRMPHLLVAGTTGSGKSVCVNNIILSFLYNSTPQETKMIMIDPKMVEMTAYNELPHMLIPVVTDSNKAAGALRWALNEMETRYTLFSKAGVKELSTYNANVENEENKKPAIVVFVDELADLMMVAKAEVEEIICRIAQKGRAAGIHLVLATQRPSVNVITGVIKANIPSRIAFHVVSPVDSRTILDSVGAEKLLGRGDMLFNPNGAGSPKRLQGAFVSEQEIADITDFIKANATAEYSEDVINEIEKTTKEVMGISADEDGNYDELLPEAVKLVISLNEASTSLLQRKMRLGYARAARIIDEMEDLGVIGTQNGSKRREVLIGYEEYEQMFGKGK